MPCSNPSCSCDQIDQQQPMVMEEPMNIQPKVPMSMDINQNILAAINERPGRQVSQHEERIWGSPICPDHHRLEEPLVEHFSLRSAFDKLQQETVMATDKAKRKLKDLVGDDKESFSLGAVLDDVVVAADKAKDKLKNVVNQKGGVAKKKESFSLEHFGSPEPSQDPSNPAGQEGGAVALRQVANDGQNYVPEDRVENAWNLKDRVTLFSLGSGQYMVADNKSNLKFEDDVILADGNHLWHRKQIDNDWCTIENNNGYQLCAKDASTVTLKPRTNVISDDLLWQIKPFQGHQVKNVVHRFEQRPDIYVFMLKNKKHHHCAGIRHYKDGITVRDVRFKKASFMDPQLFFRAEPYRVKKSPLATQYDKKRIQEQQSGIRLGFNMKLSWTAVAIVAAYVAYVNRKQLTIMLQNIQQNIQPQ